MTQTTLSEDDSRMVAGWAGRKLSDYWLKRLSKAHNSHDTEKFDAATEELFAAKCCTSSERLGTLLQGDAAERLNQFRDALWRYVAPAIEDYTDLPRAKRVERYLQDLEYISNFADEATQNQEVMA